MRFDSLTQGNLYATEYEDYFYEISRNSMTIVLDEAKRVHRFLRRLNISIRSYVFREAREDASF